MWKEPRVSRIVVHAFTIGWLTLVGCSPSPAPPGPSAAATSAKPAAPFSIVHPERKSLRRVVEQPGTIEAYEETQLFARVPGYVRLFYDKDGRITHDIGRVVRGPKYDSTGTQLLEAGEVLAELVVPELEQKTNLKKAIVRQTEVDVEQAQKAVASAEANIAAMEAAVAEAKAQNDRWESESKRIAKLVATGTIDEQSRDETRNQFKAASAHVLSTEAAVRKAKADRAKALADVRSAEARVDVARADVLEAEAMLGYAKIRAPYDGIVTSLKARTGNFVQPAGGSGDWLFKVARLDPVRVVIAVPEADAELVSEKSQVKLSIPAYSSASLSGTVARTSWVLEAGSRTLRTEIDLPNPDGRLRPQMYAYALIINQLSTSWTLPASAVLKQGDSTVCFLVEGGKAIRTPVKIGRSDGQFVAVLKRLDPGSPGSWVDFTGSEDIVARANGLTDGQAVEIKPLEK